MLLTDTQMQYLYREGYVVVHNLLQNQQVRTILNAINNDLGDLGMDPERLAVYQHDSYCPELREDPALVDLFNGGDVFRIAESLVGAGNLLPINLIQIALRFPTRQGSAPKERAAHLDGLGTGLNGIPRGTYRRSFTVLCVALLSDLPEPNMGNFTVLPGSHIRAQEYFKRYGHRHLENGLMPLEDFRPARQITGKAGDVIFAHHMVLHRAAVNTSPFIRYAVILRFRHKNCSSFAERAFTDMWREWDGLSQRIIA